MIGGLVAVLAAVATLLVWQRRRSRQKIAALLVLPQTFLFAHAFCACCMASAALCPLFEHVVL